MSQVRNLRAMFENKGEAVSPPERGRTPGPSDAKPLSKVRTNFIAVEKDGRVGLRRDQSGESSVSRRRLSNETTEGAETVATSVPEKPESVIALEEPIKSVHIETTAESAPISFASQTSPTTLSKATSNLASPQRPIQEPKVDLAPKTAAKSATKQARDPPTKQSTNAKADTHTRPRPAHLNVSSATKPSTRPGAKSPSAIKPLASPSLREPRVAKAPRSPAVVAPKKTASTATPSKPASAAPSQKATPSSAARKPPPIHVSPSNSLTSGIGFVKPKPKSPTKPVRLPASLMAQTAASGSKINSARLSSGSAGGHQAAQPVVRSSSRASTSTAASTLRRKSSSIGRPRPSVGPPPKKTTQEKPALKKEKQVDESFLSRMMRPTQSSKSKTSEKAPVTPPRKPPVKRAPTRQGDQSGQRGENRVRSVSSNRRLASRSVSPSRTATPGSAAKEPAAAEPITEEMVEVVKAAASQIAPAEPTEPAVVADVKDTEPAEPSVEPAVEPVEEPQEPQESQESQDQVVQQPSTQDDSSSLGELASDVAKLQINEEPVETVEEVATSVADEPVEPAVSDETEAIPSPEAIVVEDLPVATEVDAVATIPAPEVEQETW